MSNVLSVKFALKLSMKEERNVVSAIIEEREESKVDAVVVEQVKLVRQIFCCRGTGETDTFCRIFNDRGSNISQRRTEIKVKKG